ncbi:MAG: ABC-2 family transporter protein [Patescibacteria group bacterium]|jgi:ABC-type uncharacterized transport system permease subunit
MKRVLRLFYLFSKYSLKSTFLNVSGVILYTIGKALRFMIFFSFVYFIMTKTRLLAGYNLQQMLVFFLTYNILDTIAQILFREVYRFRQLVVSGELDTILVKPYHPFSRILIGGVDFIDVLMAVPYISLLIWFIVQTHIITGIGSIMYVLLCLNALVIACGLHIIVLALGILTTEVDHTIMIYRDLSRFGSFPIDIYREPIKGIFTFIIPIGVMMSFPAKALFGLLEPEFIIMSFGMGMLFLGIGLYAWEKATERYQSWGS